MLDGGENLAVIKDSESTIAALIALINDFLDLGKLEAGQKMLIRSDVSLEELKRSLEQCSELAFCDLQIVSHYSDSDSDAAAKVLNIDLQRIVDSIVYLCHLQISLKVVQGARVKILNGNLDGKFCLYIYCAGAKVPKVIRENCAEGYGLVQVGHYSGLHLALCRAVISAHGGSLQVEPVAGSEAFRIMLPQFGTRL
jgi:K+-sensing histidine kinase KdpD